jgi:ribonuclease VapC
MIVVDTSALMAILLREPAADRCISLIEVESELAISAATLAEALVVAERRNIGDEMARLLERLNPEILPVFARDARRVADAYARWGKGQSPAALNLCDCFAYAAAQAHACPLLYVGDDFSRTDIAAPG